jgi:hypothetical protein
VAVKPWRSSLRLVCQSNRRQCKSRETQAEFLQRAATRDGLSHVLGQLIEFVVHNFLSFWFGCY